MGGDVVDEVDSGLEVGEDKPPRFLGDRFKRIANSEEADPGLDTDGDGVRRRLPGDALSWYCTILGDAFSKYRMNFGDALSESRKKSGTAFSESGHAFCDARVRISDMFDEFESGLDCEGESIRMSGIVSVINRKIDHVSDVHFLNNIQ